MVIFFVIYLGIINNQNLERSVRFNAMQAILLDIILIVPSLLERSLPAPNSQAFLQLYITFSNTIFLFVLIAFFYGVVRPKQGLARHVAAQSSMMQSTCARRVVLACRDAGVAGVQGSCLVGQVPRIPLVAEAADSQVR